jgi:anti-sigma factor RsiW
MTTPFRQSDLEAYLDEALPPEEMARVEKAARGDRKLNEQLAAIQSRRSAGVHSLGEIWRRHRLSCPEREDLASFLSAALPESYARYIAFHVEAIGCRYCRANLADLRSRQQAEAERAAEVRRRTYLKSSARYLRGKKAEGGSR